MLKRFLALMVIFMVVFTSIPVMAADAPIIYKDTITITEEGGRYQIGFINVEFKKEFVDASRLPVTFDVEVYLENGVGYIQFSPDMEGFIKQVHLRVDNYDGYLYDKAKGENVKVDIKKQQVKAAHFSRIIYW